MELENKHRQKIPGSEKLTRPEELTYLSKFLKCVREVQDDLTELGDSTLGIVGRETGSIPKINELPNSLTKLENAEDKDIKLINNTVGLDNLENNIELNNSISKLKLPELDHLNDSVDKLQLTEVDHLDNSITSLKDDREESLVSYTEKLNNNNEVTKLGNILEIISDDTPLKLSNTKQEINVKDYEVVSLSTGVVGLNIDDEISLREDRSNLVGNLPETSLVDDKTRLVTNNDIVSLGDKIDTIEDDRNINLSETFKVLDVNEKINLNDYVSSIVDDKKVSLNDYISNLSIEGNIKLGDSTIKLNADDDSKLTDTVVNIKDESEFGVSDYVSNLTNHRDIVSLGDTLILNPVDDIDSLDDTIVSLDKDPEELYLSDTIIKNKIDSGVVEELDEERINKPIDDLITAQKELLQSAVYANNIKNNNWLFNTVMYMLDSVASANSSHLEYSHNDLPNWIDKIKALVSTYLSGDASAHAIIDFKAAMDDIYRQIEAEKYLDRYEDFYDSGQIDDLNEKAKAIINLSYVKRLVKPKPPKIGEGDFLNTMLKYGQDTLDYVIRKRAEEIVDAADYLVGVDREKALTEVLVYLSQVSDYAKIGAGKFPGLLPGDTKKEKDNSRKLLNTIWQTAGATVDTVNMFKKAKSGFSAGTLVKSAKTFLNIGANAISGVVDNVDLVKNRPIVRKYRGNKNKVFGILGLDDKLLVDKDKFKKSEDSDGVENYEVTNRRPRVPENAIKQRSKFQGLNKTKNDLPYVDLDKQFDTNSPAYYRGKYFNFKNEYLSSEGIQTTLNDLCNVKLQKTAVPSTLEELKQMLIDSPYITTIGKFGEPAKKYGSFKTYSLADNGYWDVVIEPFVNDELNGGWSYLPAIQEINIVNQRQHGVNTGYGKWVPIINFDFERSKIVTKSAALFEGEIVYPTSAELMNDLRITIVDDSYKSWSSYFRKCMEVSVYNSIPHYKLITIKVL